MSLSTALEGSDLPSRRHEDWRWTDLRGLIRNVPPVSPVFFDVIKSSGPFEGQAGAELIIANGRQNWWPGEDTETVEFFEHGAPDNPYDRASLPMAAIAADNAIEPRASIIQFNGDDAASVRFVSATDGTSHHARLGEIGRAHV